MQSEGAFPWGRHLVLDVGLGRGRWTLTVHDGERMSLIDLSQAAFEDATGHPSPAGVHEAVKICPGDRVEIAPLRP